MLCVINFVNMSKHDIDGAKRQNLTERAVKHLDNGENTVLLTLSSQDFHPQKNTKPDVK